MNLKCVGVVLSAAMAHSATAQNVGIVGNYFATEISNRLQAFGSTTVLNPNLDVDLISQNLTSIYISRDGIGQFNPSRRDNLINFLNAGGCVATEFTATNGWFNGTLGNLSGALLTSFYTPSGSVSGGNLVDIVNNSNPLAAGVFPEPWISNEPVGVIQRYSRTSLDPALDVVAVLPVLQPYGTLPEEVVIAGTLSFNNGGRATLFFSDFGDFVPANFTNQELQMLGNSICATIPAPGAMGVLALAGIAASRRRR